MRPIALHYLVALLAMIFIAGVAPRAILLTGGPELPGSGELSSPLPVFILSMLVSAFLLWELVRTLRGKATIEAVQLEKQHEALHDPLTGAANRRNFELSLREAIELTDPRHALLMIDLDNFKPVNDIYGHAAGDQILCGITAGIKRLSRPSDLVCRLGGDEFAVLLSDVDLAAAEGIACELLDFVRGYRIIKKGHAVQVGTSIGMVLIDRPGLDQTSILEASDVALYAAKEAGRGAVMMMEIPADFKTNRHYSTSSARRVDLGAPETADSANSHRPTDGREQILKGIPTVAHAETTDERRSGARRGGTGPDLWITVEPATVGNDFSPGMSMKELVADAEARADGGADLVRWIIAMVLAATSDLPTEKLAKVGFSIPIPAKSVVAVPALANELIAVIALSKNPIRHLTLVMQNTEKVHDIAAIEAFISRVHLSKINVAFQIRSTSFEQIAPLTYGSFDEIHITREIHRSIKPGTSAHAAIKTLKTMAANSGVVLVASEVDNIASLQHLGELGIHRIAGPIIGPVERLDTALIKLLYKE
ncbi:MAG: diguanylate cyclase (GGDEF)-like protein [Granulosicoccus sp.]